MRFRCLVCLGKATDKQHSLFGVIAANCYCVSKSALDSVIAGAACCCRLRGPAGGVDAHDGQDILEAELLPQEGTDVAIVFR